MAGLLAVYLLGIALLGVRLAQVQVVDADRYADRSVAQRIRTVELPATRGRIYDRDGDVLATSVDSATLYADPRAYRTRVLPDGRTVAPEVTPAEAARRLSPLLGVDAGVLRERLSSDAHFVYLARQRDWSVGEQVLELDLPGVHRLTEPRRQYPAGSLASQVLGFTGIDGDGLEGLELAHEELLSGTAGRLAVEQAPSGLTIASGLRELTPAEPGTDLVLTVDREIQAVAEQAARDAMERHNAAGASVVVLDVRSGDVLAMASQPGFDPEDRDGADLASRRNRAVTDVFEPGSTQKAVTVAAAIEEGVVSPTTTFTVDDRIRIGPKTFSDSHDHPARTMTVSEIVESSSNVGTMLIADQLGEQRLYDWLQRFGYTEPTGVGFPGEVGGLLPHVDDWWVTSMPTIAIGQGVAVSLLRSATSYATLANDGEAVRPRVVRGTVGADGDLVPSPIESDGQVISPETARSMRHILRGVVDGDGGTGRGAAVPGYDVAGKTGTAKKPRTDGRGYADSYVASFVGMAPVDDPELVVAVMVDEPTDGYYGGVAAAPVFSEVMEFALRARHVPPTRDGVSLEESIASAQRRKAEAAAREAAAREAAAREGPATTDGEPGSPPVGAPAGGDGTGVAADGGAADGPPPTPSG
jgi:cell division protein FtsI (penicillin-binding protein 3)